MPSTQTDRLYGENSSLAVKAPVVAVAISNNALNGLAAFNTPVGNYAPNEGDRILVIGNNDPTTNGIYYASQSAWQRTGDFDGAYDIAQGTIVTAYLANGMSVFYQLTTANPLIGTSALQFNPLWASNQNFTQTPWEAQAPVSGVYEPSDVRRWGVIGDGVTDDSAAFQLAVNLNKGRVVWVPVGITPMIQGVTLVGAGYNGTIIRVEGELLLKASPLAGTLNYHSGGGVGLGAYVGIAFENCDRCSFDGFWNGNRANQPQDEHIYCIALSGVTNFTSNKIAVREIRGDGICMDQVSWSVNGSPDCSNVVFGIIKGYNSANDGRNLLSVISWVGGGAAEIDSYQIGGVVNGVTEPGGLDLEPDFGYQNVADLTFGTVRVVTAGNQGLGINGKALTNDATRDWNVTRISFGKVYVRNTNANGIGISVSRVRFLDIHGQSILLQTAGGSAAYFDYADHITGVLSLAGGLTCCFAGFADFLQYFDLTLNISSYGTFGLSAIGLNYGRFRGRIFGAASGAGTYHIAISLAGRGAITQSHVSYSLDVPFDGLNAGAVSASGVTIGVGTCFRDCDMSGYATLAGQISGLSIRSHQVTGRNVQNGQNVVPAAGQWANGDIFWFDTTNSGVPPGAYCIASGSPGTWKTFANMAA